MSTMEYYYTIPFESSKASKEHKFLQEAFYSTFKEAERYRKKHELPCEAIRRHRIKPKVIEMWNKMPNYFSQIPGLKIYKTLKDFIYAYWLNHDDPDPEIYQGNGVFIPTRCARSKAVSIYTSEIDDLVLKFQRMRVSE